MASIMKTSRWTITDYTIERVRPLYSEVADFLIDEAPRVAAMFGGVYDWQNFDFAKYCDKHLVWVCCRRYEPVGVMMAQMYRSVFDPEVTILFQDLLYVKNKSSGRAAHLLMKEFIAFGRANVKLVFTMRTKHSNVKERTFERLGFEKTEELYRLEV